MILGTVQYPSRYGGLGIGVKKGLEYLAAQGRLDALPLGRRELDGENLFMDVVETTTEPHAARRFEAHRRYIDIHITLQGEEWYGYAPVEDLKAVEPYSAERDIQFFTGEGVYFQVPAGQFVLFFPEDAHKPCVCFKEPGNVRKLILKVLL
ncbi:YhcH/YjgK/YiaL family protein [uncultured Fretibacterium sp.]|uniref:YhcH/YjgK/YiaL family protein n=1 Tax=uncultured Fretibacterium sp. TaxID=1678694 RepID=UPI00325FDE90